MQEYEHLLARLQDFLSYEEIINNAEVINAYDYINLLRKEYNKSRKISVSESLVDRIDRGYELIQKSGEILLQRIIKNNNFEDVAILLPHNEDVINIHRQLTALGGNYEMRYNDKEDWRNSKDTLNFDSTNPKIMTYHSAKGLQFETVFLPFIENFEEIDEHGKSSRKALYVAMTRTYKYLYVMYTDCLPSPLSCIDKNLYEENEVDTNTVEDW